MVINIILAFILIYFVMASLFESIVFPFAILFSIFYAVVGVFWFFLATVVFGATVSIDVVFNLISGAYGLMAIPTMVATLMLSKNVMAAARDYFQRHPY